MKFYEAKTDKNLSIYHNCEYIGTINLWNGTIFEIGESGVVKTVDCLLESYDKNLFDNRFRNHMNLTMVDSETLNPEARLEYSIINNQAIAALIDDDMYIVGYSEGV